MTLEFSAHLSEEALQDVLIGIGSPDSDAHLALCSICRGQLQEFRSDMQLFNRTSLAWSEARSAAALPAAPVPKFRNLVFAPASWILAATLLLAIGLPMWNHNHRSDLNLAPVPASLPEDSQAQIAQDNDLLREVNAALNQAEESPLNEYHLSDRPHPRRKARPELRKQ